VGFVSTPPASPPVHRAILAVDVERSTARNNAAKAALRAALYELVEDALGAGGIAEAYRDPLIDRGDGVLVLVRPVDEAPKTLLLNPVIPVLTRLLATHNAACPEQELRLRAVVHAGEVHYDSRGCFGESLDVAFRLLDAPEVKRALSRTAAPLVLVTSDDVYRSIVRQGYDGIDDSCYVPLRVWTAGHEHQGWVRQSARLTVVSPKVAG